MYAPVRAGTRGGAGDFKWSDVKDDKDRENYLGHSILAPKGRWQNGRDVTWYNKDAKPDADAHAAEIRQIKEQEEDAISVALGFAPIVRRAFVPPSPGEKEIDERMRNVDQALLKATQKREKAERKAQRAEKREEKVVRSGMKKEKERERDIEEGRSRGGGRERESSRRGRERSRSRSRSRSCSRSPVRRRERD